MDKQISIQFKSTAYRMLKKMPGKLWFIFGEFIDNSISSYLQNRELLERINGSDFTLKIELSFDDDDQIKIFDNAAGIDHKNWLRALQPGDIPEDDSGLNEFGMGMKYSAVWLSDYWTLKSKSIHEPFQKEVSFDYNKVISLGLENLPYKEISKPKVKHGTELILTKLDKDKLRPFPKKKIQKHISSIYRNFIRNDHQFYSKYKVDSKIEIIAFDKTLSYSEPGFLKTQWHKDRHSLVPIEKSPEIEWKYEFDKLISNPLKKNKEVIRFSGFIGILSEIKQGNNGFSYFRRGRVVEGSGDEKIFPKKLSTNPGSFRFKRLFGEFHFNDTDSGKVESTFNKNAFQDVTFINYCIDSLALELRSVSLSENPGRKYNFLQQADKHRSSFDPDQQKKTIEKLAEKEKQYEGNLEIQHEIVKHLEKITSDSIKQDEESGQIVTGSEIPNAVKFKRRLGDEALEYHFNLLFWESIDHDAPLYSMETEGVMIFDKETIKSRKYNTSSEFRVVNIKVNLKHGLFMKNESFRRDTQLFGMIINNIKCLCYAQLSAKASGATNVHFMKNAYDQTIETFLHE